MKSAYAEGVVIQRGMTVYKRGKGEVPGMPDCEVPSFLCGTEKGMTVLCDGEYSETYGGKLCESGINEGCPFHMTRGMAALTVYGLGLSGDGMFLIECLDALEKENIYPVSVYCSDLAVTFALSEEEAMKGKLRLCRLLSFYG